MAISPVWIKRAGIADKPTVIGHLKELWRAMKDDGSPDPGDELIEGLLKTSALWILIPMVGDKPAGVIMFVPDNTVCYDMHTYIAPEFRGKMALEIVTSAGVTFFLNCTEAQKIVTSVPRCNLPAKVLARRAGMRLEGINRESFLWRGKLYDQYQYGICRREVPPCR